MKTGSGARGLELLDLYRGLAIVAVMPFHHTARLPGLS